MEEQFLHHSKIQILEATAVTNSKLEAERKLFPLRFVEIDAKKEQSPLPTQKISLDVEKNSLIEKEQVKSFEIQKDISLLNSTKVENTKEDKLVNETEKHFDQNIKIEQENIVLENTKLRKADSKKLKNRLKVCFVAMICVLTCLGGWSIYNAIKIETLNAQEQLETAEYNINIAKVITNISKLDDLTNPNSITNLDELSSAQIIEVAPKNELFPKTLEKHSNWFDRVCNWLSNLFK